MKSASLRVTVLAAIFAFIHANSNRLNHKGQDIFLNGINLAWGHGSSGFCSDIDSLDPSCFTNECLSDQKYIEGAISELSANGGNSMRVWLLGDGGILPVQNGDYGARFVDAVTPAQVASTKWLLDVAQKYNVLINLCVWSFDMVNDNGYGPKYGLWNRIITDDDHRTSFLSNWLTPLIRSVKDHNSLLSVEVFNEPEGMIENWGWTSCNSNSADCQRITIFEAQKFANHFASAIHDISNDIKVTVGSWSYVASSSVNGNSNIWSDAALIAAGGRANGVLDYYQIHYYNWAYPYYSPFLYDASYWGADDKPHVIGEFPADPSATSGYSYDILYQRNYAGAWGWCFNCDESQFDKNVFFQNTRFMQDAYGQYGWPAAQAQCTDTYPFSDGYTCADQAAWGKCGESYMRSPACDKSCGRCVVGEAAGRSEGVLITPTSGLNATTAAALVRGAVNGLDLSPPHLEFHTRKSGN